MDYRLLWFVKCINNVFEIGTESETENLFMETLNKNEGLLKRQFIQFLESSTINRNINTNIFYVYITTVKKVIKEEIEVEEELSEFEIQSLRDSDSKKKKKKHNQEKRKKKRHVHTEDTLTSGDSPATDSDKESDDGKSRDGYSSPDTAIQMADEDGIKKHSEKFYKKIKVIQEKIITLPELHVHFGCMIGNLNADLRYLYFVKNTNSIIPVCDLIEEANFYMPSQFLIGNKSGCLVNSMIKELENIWIPAVKKLLIDPFLHDCTTTRTEKNIIQTLASTSTSSTFVRITREIKAQHDYEIFMGERPDDYEKRLAVIDLEQIISLSELFMIESVNKQSSIEPLKENFLMELQCLLDKLKGTINYMQKKQSLNAAEYLNGLTKDNTDEVALTLEKTPALILQCVNIIENWNLKMKNLCSSIFEFRERDTIHSEFTFWSNSEASVRSIMDELESDNTKLFLAVIEKTSITIGTIKNIFDEFKIVKSQFICSCGLAKDNLKYISLIMEHYKDFISADFNTIIKMIPIWFDDLRTVWVLSSYFGKDVNMLRLLLQISNGLCENVGRNLGDLKLIFKNKNIKEISEMSFNATKMLDVWSEGYLEIRKSIEKSKFQRWEFDKCILFNKIEYIKRIAKDIHEIVATINQFLSILGPELRSIIKDMIGLDVMISRVKSLYKVFDAIDFDLFCEDNIENWNLFLKEFKLEVLRVEEECKIFIDWCFNNLRSCKEAYFILKRLQQFTSRPVFKEQLKTKYEAILRQYENELTTIETLFLTHQNNPPVSRHHPPVSGSIFWVRMLFDKIKEPITIFQSANEFNNMPLKFTVVEMFKSIGDQMKQYEQLKLMNWTNTAKLLAIYQMNSNILACIKINDDLRKSQINTPKIEDLKDWNKCVGRSNKILLDHQLMFKINFNDQVYELIEEAEMMENLGIIFSEEIQMLLAKKNSLLDDIMRVNNMVNTYNSFVLSMSNLEVEIHISQFITSFENVNLFPFNILIDNDSIMYLNNLDLYNKALLSDGSLIKLTVNITNKEVTIVPNMYVTYNNIIKNVSKCLIWSKYLTVWQTESCIQCLTVENTWETDYHRTTLYGEIINNNDIREKIEIIRESSHSLMIEVNKYLKRLDLSSIINQMKLYTRELILSCADQLIKSTRHMMHLQEDIFNTFRILMDKEIKNSDDFYNCLYKIEELRTEKVNVEIFFQNLNHRIYVLEEAEVTMPLEDLKLISYIQDDWIMLQQMASKKKLYLEKAKAIWSHTVKINIHLFSDIINTFLDNYNQCGLKKIKDDLDLGLILMNEYNTSFTDLMQKKEKLVREEKLFNLKLLNTNTFDKYYSEFQNMKLVYLLYDKQKSDIENWSKIPWSEIKIEFVREVFGALMLKFKRLPFLAQSTHPAKILVNYLKELRHGIPILLQLKNNALKPRHWKEMLDVIGVQFNSDKDILSFGTVLKMRAVKHKHIIQNVLTKAIDEYNIEQKLREINERWNTMRLNIEKYSNIILQVEHKLCGVHDVLQILEDDQITMHKMMNSHSVEPFLIEVETWQKNLSIVNEVLNKWWFVQQKWFHLAQIFGRNDFSYILPKKIKKLNELNTFYKEIMANANRNSKVLEQCLKPNIMNQLLWLECNLDVNQKELNSFIIEKRNCFPRFYLISDNDLLFLYGNSDPIAIQEYIIQIFDNIKSLTYEIKNGSYSITAMTTCNDEVLVYTNCVAIKNAVDKWMLEVIDQMQKSNRYMIKKAILDLGNISYLNNRSDWINNFPLSVCLNADSVWWTVEVENIFNEINLGNTLSMKQYLNQLNTKINEIVVLRKKEMLESKRNKYSSVLISDIYHRDIIESFVVNNVTSANSFEWNSILKSYWIKSKDNLFIAQCSGLFNYGYEYMGSNKSIIITPLTNRIFLTFTQALLMCLGGATHGPTGTGKTETTLAMALILGNWCKVINCSDGLDHQTISQFLNGICQSKIWGLFTKFNRISLKTLSVVSTLLFSVKYALFENKNETKFHECDININPRVGIFITMNVDEMNGQQKEINDIIKNHFRPVICLIPDFEQICFTILYSEGFLQAKILSTKISLLYKLCKEGLSNPLNSVFDLRSLKLVIKSAKNLIIKQPDLEEHLVIMKTLRDFNLPKLIDEDIPLFLSFISDLFPNVKYFKSTNNDINATIEIVLKREKLIKIDSQVEKINQIMDALTTRNSISIVGPTSGGKSVIINILCETLNHLKMSTKIITLNPKAFTKLELYGYVDPITKIWNDGLLTNIFRNINQPIVPNNRSRHFILFDGDIDSIWINDLNPVMDDNKMLTLSNGEKIRIKPLCNLLFEVGNLAHSAPSTISRMGIIYVDPYNLGYMPFWLRWLESRSLIEQTALDQCFQKYVPELLNLIFENANSFEKSCPLRTAVPQTKLNMITQLCFLLDTFLPLVSSDNDSINTIKRKRSTMTNNAAIPLNSMISFMAGMGVIEAVFIQALYFSLGVLLTDETARYTFDETVKKLSGFTVSQNAYDQQHKPSLKYIPCDEPTWYDYFLDFNKLEWIAWKKVVPEYIHNDMIKFDDILIPTLESTRLTWILTLINEYYFRSAIFKKVKRPTIIVGKMSSGKTAIMKYFMRNLEAKYYIKMAFNFSARTSSLDVQKNLEINLEKHSRKTYGPPIGKRLVYFIDDLNLPQLDECGSQQPIALLKGIFDKQGMYDRCNNFDWKDLVNICFFAAMNHVGGGRNELDTRFLSLCSVFSLPFPSENTIRYIFNSILSGHTISFTDNIKCAVNNIVDMTLNLYKLVLMKLHQTPDKFIYVFNLCHISCIINGMTQISLNKFTTTESFVRVWRNEFTRVICDRLIYQQDRELIERHLIQEVQSYFPLQVDYVLRDPLLFGDCRNAIKANDQIRIYEDLIDYDSVFYLFQEILLEYKKYHGVLDMVLFNEALDHLVRIHRMLRMSRGHVLLIGMNGNGKKSLSKLAAFTSGFEVRINSSFYTNHNVGMNKQNFEDNLKNVLSKVGVENQPVVFIIDKVDIIEEEILEFINNILTNGFVPSLYTDQKENLEIIQRFRDTLTDASNEIAADFCWDMFLKNCLNNLRVVLLMSPGNNLRLIFRNYPGFVNKTYIDWIHKWPLEALHTVAEKVLINDQVISDNYINNVIKQCVYMHKSAENYASTFFINTSPKICFTFKHLVDCILMYKKLVTNKLNLSLIKSQQIQEGLEKINESTLELSRISNTLLQQERSIAHNNETCQNLVQEIKGIQILIEEIIGIMNVSSEKLNSKNEQIKNTRNKMTKLIDTTLPVLNTTKTLLNEMNLEDLTELKSLETPPESAITLLECVAIFKGLKDMNSWKQLSDMTEDPHFLISLQELDINKINQKQQTQVRTKLKFLKKTIDIQAISKVECTILNFIESVLKYCSIYHDILPLKHKVDKYEKDYLEATLKLKEHEDSLKNTQCTLFNLEKSLDDVSKENIKIKKENSLMKVKFEYADNLIQELSSIHERWISDLENEKILKDEIIGNCLLDASFLIYAGPFSLEYRKQIIYNDWFNNIIHLKLPIELNFKLENGLISEKLLNNWNLNGLPCDEYSIQNGILITQSNRFPLCIDPHNQGFNWIKYHENNNSLKILSFADFDYRIHLKSAIQYGQSVLFIDFENMDVDLKDLLNQSIQLSSINSEYIKAEDQTCTYHENFRLYLITKETNPIISTYICSNMTIINCSITQQGLEDQLLNLLVEHELKELEDKKLSILEKIYQNKETLRELKCSLLIEIISCTTPLIDNTQLLSKIEDIKSKINSNTVELQLSFDSMSMIHNSRNVYGSISKRGALFYMILYGFKTIDPLYQFSIDLFVQLFLNSINSSQKDKIVLNRISNIIKTLTNDVFEFSCISIYEKHNLLFLFQIAYTLDKDTGKLLDSELLFFIKGNTGFKKNNIENPTTWLPNKCWQDIIYLTTNFESFSSLIDLICNNVEDWKKWFYSECPESTGTIPIKLNKYFEVLMLIRCFRIDRVYQAIDNYVYKILGVNNDSCINKKLINFEFIHDTFSNLTPCVLILNKGSDPAKDLKSLAEKNDITGPTYKILSLGTCDENIIYLALKSAMHRGNWLIVQNCNFSIPFLCEMEHLLEQANKSWHLNFRLWLIFNDDSILNKSFPISLLLRSLRVIVEPSNCMKICMQDTLKKCDGVTNSHPSFNSLLYTSLFLHGILLERKKYNKIGWSLPYNFEYSDYAICQQIINICLKKSEQYEIPWITIKYLIGEIIYGGKIIDNYDRRILLTYVEEYFGDFIYSSHQQFKFYNCKEHNKIIEYMEMEKKLLRSNTQSTDLSEAINTIPLYINPEVCGLNTNVLLEYHSSIVNLLWTDMIKLYPNVETVQDKISTDWDEVVQNTTADILNTLPELYNINKVKIFYGDKCSTPSIIVLLRELEKFNALVEVMKNTLTQLAEVFLGKVEMNSTLEEVSTCLYIRCVPACWIKCSPQTIKSLARYIKHLTKRTTQYSNWSQIREPLVMWLSGLHAPKSYLTSLIQSACRKYGWSIEHSMFYTSVTRWTCESEVQREPDAGCYITGLYLEGAHWDMDKQCLTECISHSMLEKLPILAIIPVETRLLKLPKSTITIPVYVTSKRGNSMDENCVFEANLNVSTHNSFWILRGVCVVMNCE
ncbi:Dynein heavy chain, domain-2,Dynein heavy chain domain,Dynein heavy chain, domain-1,Dynein heavy chain, P- [Cinara cedri]|uniref:Dynein heavy chain, domain-2,Dynein heavy chain domain,Dynein heavy chain, domain-1,Dynein heavy chain, P n=1 Tax=Cinara cedri TaxID=506608 RepID=A0A5E4MP23_9HEMI|nr:Dynein heavy chain, domain-2,Dynein heavy chain domain,Dynein heavy chain, domain-1,Dynein heavy chain, P- [Cinara cedri]